MAMAPSTPAVRLSTIATNPTDVEIAQLAEAVRDRDYSFLVDIVTD